MAKKYPRYESWGLAYCGPMLNADDKIALLRTQLKDRDKTIEALRIEKDSIVRQFVKVFELGEQYHESPYDWNNQRSFQDFLNDLELASDAQDATEDLKRLGLKK